MDVVTANAAGGAGAKAGGSTRAVFATFGTLGDLHPFLAMAREWQRRGHEAVVATCECYRDKVAAVGLPFHPVRPDRVKNPTDRAGRRAIDYYILPHLRETYEDLVPVVREAGALVTHPLVLGARLAAEKLGVPWAVAPYAPCQFFSAYDPPAMRAFPYLPRLRLLGAGLMAVIYRAARWWARSRFEAWHRFRAELGLPPAETPIAARVGTADLTLAMFSEVVGGPQPDWPKRTCQSGFMFYDEAGPQQVSAELQTFLDAGPAPIVVSFGTGALQPGGRLYRNTVAAAQALGRRLVVLVRADGADGQAAEPPPGVFHAGYTPHSKLFPQAAALIVHGGSGTVGQALRSGRPMLVVPFEAFDQWDNGMRAVRLGVARLVRRRDYEPARVAAELRRVLDDPRYAERADEVGRRVRAERGAAAACDAIEGLCVRAPA